MSVRADLRNIATIERLSREILKQCGHYRDNIVTDPQDSIRIVILRNDAATLYKVAEQGVRRWEREHRP